MLICALIFKKYPLHGKYLEEIQSKMYRIHKEKYGYHPYVFELAKLVREGYFKRSAALKKLRQKENSETIEWVKKKLDL